MHLTNKQKSRSSDHLGARLQSRRVGFDLSVSDVAASTHIRDEYITAIERLDEDALPAIGYTLGFVRTYAQALGMDGDMAVKDYKSDIALTSVPLRDAPHVILRHQFRLPRGSLSALTVLGIAVMLGTWYGAQSDAIASPSNNPASVPAEFSDLTPVEPIMTEGLYTLRTTAPSWVQVQDAAGTTLISRIFVKGETWQGPADGGYVVSVRDAGAVEFYDGATLIGPLGAQGEPINGLMLSLDLSSSERP